jgi:hypothetical protein
MNYPQFTISTYYLDYPISEIIREFWVKKGLEEDATSTTSS